VSVKSKTAIDMSKHIVTENIIGLAPGTVKRKTSIGSNLTPNEIASLKWKIEGRNDVVKIESVEGDNGSQYLTALSPGETQVVVSFGQIERYIKVYVNSNIDSYKAVNMDNRYYILRRNDEMTLNAFHAAMPAGYGYDDQWIFSPVDNKVVSFGTQGKDSTVIKGINEGIATILLYNEDMAQDDKNIPVKIVVEVSNTAPKVEDVIDDWYMTAFKTVYALNPVKTTDAYRVTVNGVRFPQEELQRIKWRVKSEEINGIKKNLGENEESKLLNFGSSPQGPFIDIMPRNKVGTAILTASHPRSVNQELDITVICDANLVAANPVPHIVVDKELVRVAKLSSTEITLSIEDAKGFVDVSAFTASSDDTSKVMTQVTGNKLTVRGIDYGQALVTISHSAVPDMQKKIVVMVVAAGDLVYLTTQQNFVVLEKNAYQAVSVELVGFNDVNNRNFVWNTDDGDIISINASGKSAVITAKNVAKTAKITVTHAACPEYPLFIYVRVTDKSTSKPVYITTSNNIVSLKEGASVQIKGNLVNGGAHELSQFQWSSGDRHLIELNYSGDTAMVKGLKPGTAQVVIWHPSSLNSLNILVVVEPLEPNNGIYITTDSLMVEIGTNESQRLITARLVGGNAEDKYGFQWSITQQNSILRKEDGTGYQIIDMNANADMCYLYPKKQGGVAFEGEAVITVSHPKTNYKLDIKIMVVDKTDIAFEKAYATMNQYEQLTVNVTASTNSKLSYTSTNRNVVSVEGIGTMCVLDAKTEGTVIIIVSNMSGTKSSEMIVNVKPIDLNNYFYLRTASNIVVMSNTDPARTVSAEVVDSKTGLVNEELTNAIKWKIKESDQFKGVVKLNNSSNPTTVVTNHSVNLYPGVSGDIEVIFGFFDPNDPLFERYPTLKNNCAGKTMYVKVEIAASLFVLSHSVIKMGEADTVDGVWARVDNVIPAPNYGDWDNGGEGEIMWRSEKPEVVTVVYRNDTNQRSNVSLIARKTGSAQIYVNYGASQQIISVIVEPLSYITTNKTNISLMPFIKDTFVISANPIDKNISFEMSINAVVSIEHRPVGGTENDWSTGITVFQAGENGHEFRVTGNENQEGNVTITFELKETGKKTQVTVTNMKNYFVRWRDKAQIRFAPNGNNTDNVGVADKRVYYDTSPLSDYLTIDEDFGYTDEFDVAIRGSGNDKYIEILPSKETGKYKACGGRILYFYTKETQQRLELQVFIYYDKVDVTFNLISKGTHCTYDDVNYSITVGRNETVEIELIIDPAKPDSGLMIGHNAINNTAHVDADPIVIPANAKSSFIPNSNTAGIIKFSIKNNGNPGANIINLIYKGILNINYEYFNGSTLKTAFTRNFILYDAELK